MYVIFSLLVFLKILQVSAESCGTVAYDTVAMVVALDASETALALCSYLGCSIICVLLCSCLMVFFQ